LDNNGKNYRLAGSFIAQQACLPCLYRSSPWKAGSKTGRWYWGRGAKALIFSNKHCIFKRLSAPGEIRSAHDSVNCTG